jgi:hypothetical protein
MLLKNFLIDILKPKGTHEDIIKVLMNEIKGVEHRLELFKKLAGMKLKTFLWEELRKKKLNLFIDNLKPARKRLNGLCNLVREHLMCLLN